MLGSLSRRGCRVLALAFLIAAVPLDQAFAGVFYFNTDFKNLSGTPVNDLEIILQSSSAIHVNGLFSTTSLMAPTTAFPPGTISNNDTSVVDLSWSGSTIGNGVWTHVGAYGTDTATVSISSANWTIDGFPAGGVPIPSVLPYDPLGSEFGVVRATLYSALSGGEVIGHLWYELPADDGATTFASVFNANSQTPTIYASWAFNTPSSSLIPLDALNESLTGFGPESPIRSLVTPEPSSLLILGLGLGVCGCFRHRKQLTSPADVNRTDGRLPALPPR